MYILPQKRNEVLMLLQHGTWQHDARWKKQVTKDRYRQPHLDAQRDKPTETKSRSHKGVGLQGHRWVHCFFGGMMEMLQHWLWRQLFSFPNIPTTIELYTLNVGNLNNSSTKLLFFKGKRYAKFILDVYLFPVDPMYVDLMPNPRSSS